MGFKFVQTDFGGGMNLLDQDCLLSGNEYGLAYNVRNREASLKTIAAAVEDTDIPVGKKQGIFAFDDYLLVFVAGRAYYKNIAEEDATWTMVEDLALDTSVDYIYTQAVPASTINYERKLETADQVEGNDTDSKMLITSIAVNGTEAGLVVQDGVNQPWLILPDATATQLSDYAAWTTSNREYVPIMKQMAYMNGILFGVAPDGVTIYRSVSGRPLDFVVNVTITGAKGGTAATVSYSIGTSQITCLTPLKTGELFVGTVTGGRLLDLSYEKTIFAEPTFINRKPINSAVVNQYSLLDISTDYAFIDFDGIRSLTAIVGDKSNEGRNSVFSARISNSLDGIYQTTTASIVFDDYAFFALNTIYGNLVAVYDIIRAQWVCFDNYGFTTIKQFAVADQDNNPTLYAITDTKLYKLFSSATNLQASVAFKAATTGEAASEVRLDNVRGVFTEISDAATLTCLETYNDTAGVTISADMPDTPVFPARFNYSGVSTLAWKVAPKITWNEGTLILLETSVQSNTSPTGHSQAGNRYA